MESILNLIGVFILFLLILAGAYFTSRWLGKSSLLHLENRNIKLIETFRLGQNSFIQILKIGEKYIAVGVTKEHVEFLTELKEEEIQKMPEERAKNGNSLDFKDVLAKISKKNK